MRNLILTAAFCIGAVSPLYSQNNDYPIQPVPFTAVKVTDNFWAPRIKRNHEVTIPIALKQCYKTGRIDNFMLAAGIKDDKKLKSELPFDDSDVFKIIEGASFSLQTNPDPELEAHLDALIYYIGQAQEEDGYLFTHRSIDPDDMHPWIGKERWETTWDLSHELYNLGHMYEAAVAHYQATGKRNFLDIAIKSADLVCNDFGPGKLDLVPGHQEIEMGLVKLYRVTGERKYLDTAKFFLDMRGKDEEHSTGEYSQNHLPVTQQDKAVGHSVRAAYMYAGMADVAALVGDKDYLTALDKIWMDILEKKYYITGGIGAAGGHEGFGPDYDLPNMSAYNETCASIAQVFWNHRMFLLQGDAKFYDILERTLYNGTVSGVSLTADHFFYPNPLESIGQHSRSEWFGTACCPSNLSRFIPSVPGYIYAQNKDRLYVNLFVNSEAEINLNGTGLAVSQKSNYPWDGAVEIMPEPEVPATFELAIRLPGWTRNQVVPTDLYYFTDKDKSKVSIQVNGKAENFALENGYALLHRKWEKGDVINLNMPMPVRKILAKNQVAANKGKMALQRGPIVYALEWADNKDEKVRNLVVDKNASLNTEFRPELLAGVQVITGSAKSLKELENNKVSDTRQDFTAIPYYAWANRGEGEMTVWIPYSPSVAIPAPLPTVASRSKVTASFESKSLLAVHDQNEPTTSGDREYPYYHWWPELGSTQWVEYNFEKPEIVSNSKVFWYDDSPQGGCRIPEAYKVLYKDSHGAWKEVNSRRMDAIEKDRYNEVVFEAVETSALRLEVHSKEDFAAGIHEWIVQ